MAEQWYYRLLGEEFGPVTQTALRELINEGTIGASDEVRRDGESQWQRAGGVDLVGTETTSDGAAAMSDLDSLLGGSSSTSLSATDGPGAGDAAASDLDAMLAPSTPGHRRTDADAWYYRVSGQRFGPFDFDTLFEHASSGQFSRYDEIRSPGSDEWVEAETIVGLFPDEAADLDALLVNEAPLPASAAPKPAPAKKEWYYRVLNQELGPVDFEGLFDLVIEGNLRPDDEIRESGQTEWQRADSLVGLFPDHLSEDAASPAAAAGEGFADDSEDAEDAEWYFKMDDEEFGPVTFERLMQLAQKGRLQPSDPIRLTKLGSWMDAGSMVGLFPEDSPPEPEPPQKKTSSLPDKPTGDADDWAAAVLAEDEPEPPPRRSASAPRPSEPAADRSAPSPAAEPAPAAAAALSIATKMAATSSAQRPTFTPPPKSSRKPSSGGGGFSLPSGLGDSLTNPKVLGAVGAIVVAVALYFIPWGGLFSPPFDDLVAELETIWGQVKPLYDNEAPAAEWESVAGSVGPKLSEIAQEATDRGAGPDHPELQIVLVLASQSIPKVLDDKSASKPTQVKVVDNFFMRLKEI